MKHAFSKLFPVFIFFSLASYLYLYFFACNFDTLDSTTQITPKFQLSGPFFYPASHEFRKIVVGTVCCRADLNDIKPLQETEVLIKSLFISAFLHNVTYVEIYILLEHQDDMSYLLDKVKHFGLEDKGIKTSLYFGSAIDLVPEQFKQETVDRGRRCGQTRLYFPNLPTDLDSIIYLDTDSIITGNIWQLWTHLQNMEADLSQMIGLVANNEPKKFDPDHKAGYCFFGTPFIKPEGFNSGLLLMNLTRLRNYNLTDRLAKVWNKYKPMPSKHKNFGDQTLLNILLRYDESILYRVPCQFNVKCSPCDHAMICKSVLDDPLGIQCIHGANDQFRKDSRFGYIYQHYLEFDMKNGDIIKDLMEPIRKSNEPVTKWEKCNEPINPHLFKTFFSTTNT